MKRLYVAIDLETTGLDLDRCAITQIGIVTRNSEAEHLRSIQYEIAPNSSYWEPVALDMHEARVKGCPRDINDVDHLVYREMRNSWGIKHGEAWPVGWNVGPFDIALLKKHMPLTASLFSYRSMELNALAAFLDETTSEEFRRNSKGHITSWKTIATRVAEQRTGRNQAHDALWDSEAAWYFLEYLLYTDEGRILPLSKWVLP